MHSCIFSGNNVIAAGEILIVDNKIVSINNESGHYRPKQDIINLTKELLINNYNYKPEDGHDGLLSITKAKSSPGGSNLIKNTKKIKKNIVTMKLRHKINKRKKRKSKRNKK